MKLTREQAKGVEENLNKAGLKCRAYVGMSYWHPFIYEAIDQIVKDGFEQIVAVSLFPQYSAATSGACLMELQSILKKQTSHLNEVVIQSWHDDPGYLDALAASIKEGLDKMGDNPTILFSAHGLPEDFVAKGDPYPKHLEETIKGVLERLDKVEWQLAYQSRSGPVKWMDPQTEDIITELGDKGVKDLLVVPISFVSDHVETLYEIDIMYKKLAEEHGITRFVRSQSLNSSSLFIKALAGIVKKKLSK